MARSVPLGSVQDLPGGSVFAGAHPVLAPVLDEPKDVEATIALECVERDLRREVDTRLRAAGELDRRAPSFAENTVDEVAKLRMLGWVDLRNGCGKQFLARVFEHRAASTVGVQDPARDRVHQIGRVTRPLEEALEQTVAFSVHVRPPSRRPAGGAARAAGAAVPATSCRGGPRARAGSGSGSGGRRSAGSGAR